MRRVRLMACTTAVALALGAHGALAQDSAPAPSTGGTASGSVSREMSQGVTSQPGVGSGVGSGVGEQSAQVSQQDRQFVQEAASGGMFEVESSQLALERSEGEAIKQFAQKMIDDHTLVNQQLRQIASEVNIQVPQELASQDDEMLQQLTNASTSQFDQQYLQAQAKAHQQAIALFQKQEQQGQNQKLKQFAQQTLPKLQQHEAMLKEIQGQGTASR